jgi:hypothetical protein
MICYFFFRFSDWRSRINAKKAAPNAHIQKIGSHLPIARSSSIQRLRKQLRRVLNHQSVPPHAIAHAFILSA